MAVFLVRFANTVTVVDDLHEIIKMLFGDDNELDGVVRLLLVGNSIGGPIIRLYAQYHPNSKVILISYEGFDRDSFG